MFEQFGTGVCEGLLNIPCGKQVTENYMEGALLCHVKLMESERLRGDETFVDVVF